MNQNNIVVNKTLGVGVSSNAQPFTVRATQKVSTHYIVDIFDTIESLSDVEDALFAMGIAEEDDTVTIRLNCYGGVTYVGDSIIMAMKTCAAPIHVQATGIVASFATFILLSADSFEISPFCEILCHSAWYGTSGKMADVRQYVDFSHKQSEKALRHYYEYFLTEEEITHIIDNKYEHYMDADEFIERFQRRNEALNAAIQVALD